MGSGESHFGPKSLIANGSAGASAIDGLPKRDCFEQVLEREGSGASARLLRVMQITSIRAYPHIPDEPIHPTVCPHYVRKKTGSDEAPVQTWTFWSHVS